ncbi:MAG: hypothetical protein H8E55_38240 [Pelagibacterales bacterium]|nr:hypothetical protein [Pelagibacterales bacterium]
MNTELNKYHVSYYAWIPSYRDFDSDDTTVMATSKEHAKEVFRELPISKFVKGEECIQTELEYKEMCDRLSKL